MVPLVMGLALFIGIHLVSTQPDLRQGLAQRMGLNAYKGLYSLLSFAGLTLIVLGYHKVQLAPGKNPVLWNPPLWGRHVTMLLMLPVFPLLVSTYLPGRISAAVRHPMITAVKFWALAHLFVRGDAASLLLFAGLLGWAVYDRISLKQREAAGLVAVRTGPARNDIVAIVLGLVIYGIFLKWGHAVLIGMPLLS
ncbi:MAG: NnrU family protein [Hyphomicrobiaceae bacterium]